MPIISQEDLTRRLGHTDKLLLLKKPFDSIEVTQLARTLTEKWYLAWQAALKLEQMELLVSQRTQKLLELQHAPALAAAREPEPPEDRMPVVLLLEHNAGLEPPNLRGPGAETTRSSPRRTAPRDLSRRGRWSLIC